MITEKYLETLKTGYKVFEIFENPDFKELQEIVRLNQEKDVNYQHFLSKKLDPSVRAIVLDNGNVIAWNEDTEVHDVVIEKLNLLKNNKRLIPIYIYLDKDLKRIKSILISGSTLSRLYKNFSRDNQYELINSLKNNSYIKKVLRSPKISLEENLLTSPLLNEIDNYIKEKFTVFCFSCPKCRVDLETKSFITDILVENKTISKKINVYYCPKCGFIEDNNTYD